MLKRARQVTAITLSPNPTSRGLSAGSSDLGTERDSWIPRTSRGTLKKRNLIAVSRQVLLLFLLTSLLCGCLSNLWTGANLVYDRHDVYKKLNDYHLLVDVNNSLYADKQLKCEICILDIAVFNGDILVAGHLPSEELINKARKRLLRVLGYRHLFIEVKLSQSNNNQLQDAWITTKIRSQIFADDSIDPNAFKIVTSDQVVYLMGDVRREEAKAVIAMARNTAGVVKVVKLLKYFTYSNDH